MCLFSCPFFFNETATTESYTYVHTLALHDALPISPWAAGAATGMLMLATALEAQAQPTCWHSYEIEAARVRDLQTMLMMSALKCGSAGDRKSTRLNSSH